MIKLVSMLLVLAVLPLGAVEESKTDKKNSTAPNDLQLQFITQLRQAPIVRSLLFRAEAAEHAQVSAGRLPDPELQVGYARMRMPMETRPIYEIMAAQSLPRWGERDASRALAVATSAEQHAVVERMIGQLASDVAQALAGLTGLQARIAAGEEEQLRINALRNSTDARVANGTATALDRLALDTRSQSLAVRIADWQRQAADLSAHIRSWLALKDTDALPVFVAPDPQIIDTSTTPQIRQALAERDQALASLDTAYAMGRPMTMIGVRGMYEETMSGSERTIGAQLSVSLPVARSAIHADIEAAYARIRAAEQQVIAARLQATYMAGIAERAIKQAERAEELVKLLAARASAEQESLITATASAQQPITILLDIIDRLSDLRIDLIDATVSAQQARATLWPYVNIPTTDIDKSSKKREP